MQRGFGWTHYIHPQINQIDTPIPINIEIGLGHTVLSVFLVGLLAGVLAVFASDEYGKPGVKLKMAEQFG